MASSCPHPFIEESLFPNTGGPVSSRWCEQFGEISCCLPCPISYWRWKNVIWLTDHIRIALWPSIPVLILLVWLLVTYAIFPANVTDRHYLTVSPVIGFIFITIAFIIPSKGQPQECYNEITPNDMGNDARCAAMGVTLFFGAWLVIISCFFRSVALHLSVCWEIKPGSVFKYISLGTTFLGSAALAAVVLSISGVQYTFGRICYLIPHRDEATFWGPLLSVSIVSLLLQLLTIAYCVVLILRPWFNYQKLRWSGYTPSADEERVLGAQRTASRIRKIVQMQWRAILITVLILIYVCFLAAVFMRLRQFDDYPASDRRAWFKCLQSSNGDKTPCLSLATSLGPQEAELWAVLYMLILSGLLAIAIFFRSSMCRAWLSLLKGEKRPLTPVHRLSDQPRPATEGDDDVEIATQTSSGQFAFSPASEAGSLTKNPTFPYYVT